MKLCVFHGDQKDLITCCNPKEMVAMGVFDSDFSFMNKVDHNSLFNRMESSDRIAPNNLFLKSPYSEQGTPVDRVLPIHLRRAFFTWYIKFYYKLAWKDNYETLLRWHRQKVWEMFELYDSLNKYYYPEWKQALLEIAWNWQQSPDGLIIKTR